MKKSLGILLCIFIVLSVKSYGQSTVCPTFHIEGPVMIYQEPYRFTAVFGDFDTSRLKLIWTTSDGQIIEGQGTESVLVKPIENKSVIVSLEVLGLSNDCPNKVSDTLSVKICYFPRMIDEFFVSADIFDKNRFENAILEFSHDQSAVLFIIESFKKNVSQKTIKKKLSTIFKLLKDKKIPKDRIVIQIFREEKTYTKILVFPKDVDPIPCSGCVQISIEEDLKDLSKLFKN